MPPWLITNVNEIVNDYVILTKLNLRFSSKPEKSWTGLRLASSSTIRLQHTAPVAAGVLGARLRDEVSVLDGMGTADGSVIF